MKDRGAGNEKEKTENFGIESGHGSTDSSFLCDLEKIISNCFLNLGFLIWKIVIIILYFLYL